MTAVMKQASIALYEIDTEEAQAPSGDTQRRTWLVRAANARQAMSFMPDGAAIRMVNLSRPTALGPAGIVGWVGDQMPSFGGLR